WLLAKVIELLKESDERVTVKNQNFTARGLVLRTLKAIDKDWAKDPAAAKVFSAVVANFRKEGVESRHEFLRVLVEVGPAAKPVVGDLVAFLAVRNVAFDEEIPKTLDQLDAGWREHPSVKTVLPELMKRLDAYPIEYRALVAVGEPVIPELLKALEGTSRGRET